MTVLKVFSYTWLTTLPSTHVTRSSEAVLVKYNYNYFFPRPNKHIQGRGKGSSSLPPTPPPAPSKSPDVAVADDPRIQLAKAEANAYIAGCERIEEWAAQQKLEHPEEGICRSWGWPSSVPSQASDPGEPTPQPKPSQAPYVAFADLPGLEQAKAEAEAYIVKACEKQGIHTLADLQGHASQMNLAAGLPGKPGTARSRSGSVNSDDSSRVTSCGSKKSKSRAERDRGPKRAAKKMERCRKNIEARGGTWSDNHRAETAALALAESGSFKGTIARANYMAHISETNERYVDEGAEVRVKDALITEAGLIISRFDTKRQV